MGQRTSHGSVVVVLPVAVAAVFLVAMGVGSGACGAALVDVDAGSDARDDSGEDLSEPDEATPPDADCGTPWFFDDDDDTWGDAASMVCEWTQPPGYVARPDDCCDANGDVHPDQTGWFATPYDDCGTASFDYDCSSVEEREPAATGGHCTGIPPSCELVIGWEGSTPPACGATGTWVSGCTASLCIPSTGSRTQTCR